jgi:hypothetical protein
VPGTAKARVAWHGTILPGFGGLFACRRPVRENAGVPEDNEGQVVDARSDAAGDAGVQVLTRAPRRAKPDAVLAAAVDVARSAAVMEAGSDAAVGDHLGTHAEEERVLSHSFACLLPGYRGWRWTVTLARAPRARVATVSEVTLLPADEALVAPAWLPWADRLAPGDLQPGVVIPRVPDDPRLEPGFEATGEEDVDEVALWELGLGRRRVLSREGREEAAQRWYDGSHGPHDPHAEQAAAQCRSCGFFVPLAGALRQVFGICANEWSPSDGQVVSLDHGCGAHSELDVDRRPEHVEAPVLDELGYVRVDLPAEES